jgi:hypothetical protein
MATGTSFNSTIPTLKNMAASGAIPQPQTATERNTYMTFLEVQLERVT